MTSVLEALAPAKVNLGLRVGARRPDGYHEIESVFAPLDFGDGLRLSLTPSDAPRVTLRVTPESAAPGGVANLAARAALAFLAEAGLSGSIAIELEKRIPVAAGLGGGSSDAGTVLRLLSSAWPDALDSTRLLELALTLGADVPFFLDPRPARIAGVGERIEPLVGFGPRVLLLVNPGVALATAEVYRAFDALEPPPEKRGGDLMNDLEPAALQLCPELRQLRDRLASTGPRAVGMSGSGPTLFGVFESREAALGARARGGFPPPVWTRVAATLECR